MLAILKTGGAFCALDVSHPDNRLAEMISDTKATVLLASPAQNSRLAKIAPDILVVEISDDLLSSLDLHTEPPMTPPKASPANLMYTIFTSGSTGRPKGVQITHRAWLTSALAYGPDQGLTPTSRVLQFASYAFDMSLMEIFTTLILGGCVCVPTNEDRYDIDAIYRFVNASGVNTLTLTPSYARLLDPAAMHGVKSLVTGGEAVPRGLLDGWTPFVDVYIAYGPTEASIQAAGVMIPRGSSVDGIASGLIGRSTGCETWVVCEDDENTLVSTGEVGELLIGGETLARGYLGDEEKTKAAFVQITLAGNSRRVFKTGDLVRQDEEGNLIFVGRKDTQIKVQGQRFELAEIETRLTALLPPGSNCCVDKVDGEAGLVAFISSSVMDVANSKAATTEICWGKVDETLRLASDIREQLAKVLPMPMIPSLFISVTSIPLTTSHKVDRKALRRLMADLGPDEKHTLRTGAQKQTDDTKISHWSANESTLRELWAQVLNISLENIKLSDNFIRLGGDSVACIRLISAARSRGLRLTSSAVLGTPILREQALKLQKSATTNVTDGSCEALNVLPFSLLEPDNVHEIRATAAAICNVPMDEVEDVRPMTIPQMRWYGKTLTSPESWIDQYYFELPSDVDLQHFKKALYSAVQAADLLRARAIVTRDRKLFQSVLKYRQPEVVWVEDESLESFLQQDLQSPMGPGQPLSRFTLLQAAKNESTTFIWTIHHAIYDGYSLPMLLQLVEEFYLGGNPAPLTPFSHYLKPPGAQAIAEGTAFWKHYLQDTPEVSWTKFPPLPDQAATAKPPSSMARLQRRLDLASSSARASITTANKIRFAYAQALLHSAASSGSPTTSTTALFLESLSGRNAPISGIDRMTGPTLVNIPTRIRVPTADAPLSLAFLEREQEVLADRMAHENFPLPLLLGLAPKPLELRNVLMIEDAAAFQLRGDGEGLFGKGKEVLKLEETEGLPMIMRCMVHGRERIEVDVRFDSGVVGEETMEGFVDRFAKVLEGL